MALELNEWLNALGTITIALLFSGVYTVTTIMLSIIIQNLYTINFWISMVAFIMPVIAIADKVESARNERAIDLLSHPGRYMTPKEFQVAFDNVFGEKSG